MPDIRDGLTGLPDNLPLLAAAAVVAGVLLIGFLLVSRLRKRRRTVVERQPDLTIDLESLPSLGPPSAGPRLEFYGTPVRLAVVVVAAAGRHAEEPEEAELLAALNDLLPDLPAVLAADRPLVRCWPSQLSTQGFINRFFQHVHLPGNRGRGTPWCSLAGRFETADQQLLAGLVCRAEAANSLGQFTIEHSGQWMDVLRVKGT